MQDADPIALQVSPIGYVRTAKRCKFDAPSQPDLEAVEENEIELLPGQQFELALRDLESFERVWLVWWFHQNKHWRPTVMPPRGPAQRRGVFSTRSPHRPNPIGLTCVTLLGIEGRVLRVGPLDLVDGTPILDIKPYLRTVDAFPESSLGWLESIHAAEREPAPFTIELSPPAEKQLTWLRDQWGIDFTERAFGILSRDPSPHRTRRVLRLESGIMRIACGAWRMYFRVEGAKVLVLEIDKGYSDETLVSHEGQTMLDREAQIAFAQWKKG